MPQGAVQVHGWLDVHGHVSAPVAQYMAEATGHTFKFCCSCVSSDYNIHIRDKLAIGHWMIHGYEV